MVGQLEEKNAESQIISPEIAKEVLQRILQSKYFSNAPKKRKFVQLICNYYWQGRADELNEYLIGREVFDRGDDYNPAADPIVRVGAHDVRKKLEQYYLKEGADDSVRLMIPIGSYVPVFVQTSPPILSASPEYLQEVPALVNKSAEFSPQTPPLQLATAPTYNLKRWIWILGAITTVLFVCVLILFWVNRRLVQQGSIGKSADPSQLGLVWNSFLQNTQPVLFVLSNPIVHRSVNNSDPEVITSKGIELNKEQADFLVGLAGNRLPTKLDSPIKLIPSANTYTGIGEAIGVFRLTQLLQRAGEETKLKQSRNVSPEDFRDYDVILLGSVYANQWAQSPSIKENFVYSRRATIENLNPLTGEAREYKPTFDEKTGSLLEDYALISVTPGVSGTNNVMLLAGIYSEGTQAAVEYVTDKNNLQEMSRKLEEMFGNSSAPKYYQALLQVKVENSYPTKTTLLTIRPLKID